MRLDADEEMNGIIRFAICLFLIIVIVGAVLGAVSLL